MRTHKVSEIAKKVISSQGKNVTKHLEPFYSDLVGRMKQSSIEIALNFVTVLYYSIDNSIAGLNVGKMRLSKR